jgi:hypothetical protein
MARGSIDEVLDDLNVCDDEGYGDKTLLEELHADAYALIRKVNSYIAYLRNCKQGGDD